jgi:membrane protein YqaA with SNARE-associated domain
MLAALGPAGLLILGFLDSSFLFMPLGNDLLMVALTARKPGMMPVYAVVAACGSVLGCLLVDAISRKGGEEGLKRKLSPRRLQFVRGKVENHAGWALGLASLMPPPFPFTPFVITAAALQYSRWRLLSVVGVARLLRFSILGLLAMRYGTRLIRMAKEPEVQYTVIAIVAISIVGTAVSIVKWIRSSRRARSGAAHAEGAATP